jgi:hypothetical protein
VVHVSSPAVAQNRYIKEADNLFENVTKFKYFGTTVTNKNCIHEEIKSRLNSGNACNHAGQNIGLPVCYLKI